MLSRAVLFGSFSQSVLRSCQPRVLARWYSVAQSQLPISVHCEFEPTTNTAQYILVDKNTNYGAIIDPVLDYEAETGRTKTASADKLISWVEQNNVKVRWLLETHIHADHLTASAYLKEKLPTLSSQKSSAVQLAISKNIDAVQNTFSPLYNMNLTKTSFDKLLTDGDNLKFTDDSPISIRALSTPGHTPACVTYVVEDRGIPICVFVGDTIFMPDSGTARCDFPGGSADQLWDSLQKILSLPPATVMFTCHDYKAGGSRDFKWETTVAEQLEKNIHVNKSVSKDQFIQMRKTRDATLSLPRLIHPSLQYNLTGGNPPAPESNGRSYIKIPTQASWRQ